MTLDPVMALALVFALLMASAVQLRALQVAQNERHLAELASIRAARYASEAQQAAHRADQAVVMCRNAAGRAESAVERTDPRMLAAGWLPASGVLPEPEAQS